MEFNVPPIKIKKVNMIKMKIHVKSVNIHCLDFASQDVVYAEFTAGEVISNHISCTRVYPINNIYYLVPFIYWGEQETSHTLRC